MPLPKLTVPLFDAVIPSNKQPVKYRPFLVKEEKILLMAQSGNAKSEMVNALKQVINNCTTTHDGKDIDIENLTVFDLEYLFIKIRSKSVDNVVTLKYIDNQDKKNYEFKVALDDIEVVFDPNNKNKIQVAEGVGVIMKFPTAAMITNMELDKLSEAEVSNVLIKECMEKIYDSEEVYIVKETDPKEVEEFIDSLNVKAFEEIQKFFSTMPKVYHKIEYTNSMGTPRQIELTSLDDFFSFA